MDKRGELSHTSIYYIFLIPILIVILGIGIYLYTESPSLTGLSQYEQYQSHTRDLNLRFESSSTINFDLGMVPASVKLTGSFEEGTAARVYLVDEGARFLILNTESQQNDFAGACEETCEIDTIKESVILSVEVDSGVLILDKLGYSSLATQGNLAPEWQGRTAFFIDSITTYDIDLDNYFFDPEGDNITYFIRSRNPFSAELVAGNILRITTNAQSSGTYSIRLFASDSKQTTEVNIEITVLGLEEEQAEPGFDPDSLTYTEVCKDFTEDNANIILTGNAKKPKGKGACYTIDADNFVLDCANAVVYADDGIIATGNNIEIKNCQIYSRVNGIVVQNSVDADIHGNKIRTNNGTGIQLKNIFSGKIYSNLLEDNLFGLRLFSSDGYNEIAGNTFSENRASGLLIADSSQAVVTNNMLNNNPMYGITLFLSENVLVANNNITGSGNGIALVANSRNNELVGNAINSSNGILFENSRYNVIRSNNVEGSISYDMLAVNNAEIK